MPFEDDFRKLYDEIIRPTVESKGFVCQMADQPTSNIIIKDIIMSIRKSIYYSEKIPPKYLEDSSKKQQYLDNRNEIRQKQWDIYCIKNNGPDRAIYFDTKELLEN